jgi:hypothetical protein
MNSNVSQTSNEPKPNLTVLTLKSFRFFPTSFTAAVVAFVKVVLETLLGGRSLAGGDEIL